MRALARFSVSLLIVVASWLAIAFLVLAFFGVGPGAAKLAPADAAACALAGSSSCCPSGQFFTAR